MTLRKTLVQASLVLMAVPLWHSAAHANDAPNVTPSLKKMLEALPMADMKDQVQGMLSGLKKTPCGGKLTGCYGTQSGPLQLYFFTSGSAQQTLLLVVDKTMAMPHLLGEKAQKVMGETSLSSPIISISTTDYELDNIAMPAALQKVVRDHYFNVNTLSFSSGVQLAARASVGGGIKLAMESMGVNTSQMTMRAAVVMPIPSDLAGSAGAGAAAADAVQHGDTMKKAGADALTPEAFVEFQFAPNATLQLTTPKVTLTDATFFLNNALTFGYKGNAAFKGAESKKIIMQFQTPLSPAGVMDLLDFEFRMATPASFTMEDAAHMMVGMATPDGRLAKYGGGFIRNINAFKDPLLTMTKPLSVVQLRNPQPPTEYRFGDSSKPFPDDIKYFNFALQGPLAQDGPLLKAAGDVTILGQKMGWLVASAGRSGLRGDVGEAITVKLGPLGKVKFKMQATMAINADKQDITLLGNFAGQKVEVGMSGSTLKIAVDASCVNPFEIKTQLAIQASTNLADVFEGQGGVNVDPSKIDKCIGKELEAAYNKIAGEYKSLSGYTAKAATEELNKLSGAAAKEAQRVANEAKDTARNVASQANSSANKAFNEAGNAFKRLGKKKKHSKGPDPKFAATVFDWDYYYDTNPDLVKAKADLSTHWRDSGFNEGRRASLEFNVKYYWSRYTDVQAKCGQTDYKCTLSHWLDQGLYQGRQGSPDFSIIDYLYRYSDLQGYFGSENYADAMDHWQTSGEDEGRDGRPESSAAGPVSGPLRIGGGGGGAWNDSAVCRGRPMTGFRLGAGKTVDRLQFLYADRGWAPRQGGSGNFLAEVNLPDGEYFVQVDYRAGDRIDNLSFKTNKGRTFGPYGGGGGSAGRYTVTPGEKLGCMAGRSGSSTDQLTFYSTGSH